MVRTVVGIALVLGFVAQISEKSYACPTAPHPAELKSGQKVLSSVVA